jgi:hypothetical protein
VTSSRCNRAGLNCVDRAVQGWTCPDSVPPAVGIASGWSMPTQTRAWHPARSGPPASHRASRKGGGQQRQRRGLRHSRKHLRGRQSLEQGTASACNLHLSLTSFKKIGVCFESGPLPSVFMASGFGLVARPGERCGPTAWRRPAAQDWRAPESCRPWKRRRPSRFRTPLRRTESNPALPRPVRPRLRWKRQGVRT